MLCRGYPRRPGGTRRVVVMRIVSLVPHATELLFALGLDDDVVGVTHECDYPPAAEAVERVTRDALPELGPDLIVTQALCPVCAVSYDEVAAIAQELPTQPRVIALDPHTLGETLGDVRTIAQATDARSAGVDLVARSAGRIDRVRLAVRGRQRPRVAAIEWLDPPYVAGHWTPQLIELAGGEDVLGLAGEPSQTLDWDVVAAAAPEIVVAMPCGYDAARAHEEAIAHSDQLRSLGARR